PTDSVMDVALGFETLDVRDCADQTIASRSVPQPATLRDDLECVPDSKTKVMDGHSQFHATIQRLEQQLQNLKDTRTDFWKGQWDLLLNVVNLKYEWAKDESCFCLDKKKGCIPNCSNERWDWEDEFKKDRQSLKEEIAQNRCQVKIPNENDCRVSYHPNSPPSWQSLQRMNAICFSFKDLCASMKGDFEVMDEIFHTVLNSCPSPLNAHMQLLNQMLGFNTERMEQFN
ncbi:hypothetical protein HDU81_001232, partial [Chytriomyces hyalinus]